MSEALPSLAELIERAIASRIADVHVSMPGEIVSYEAATQTATVKLCLRRVLLDTEGEPTEEEIPPVQNVPVVWPGGTGLTMHGVLAAGDSGDVVFSSMSHNEWQASGRVSTPGDLKPHGLASAKFYPGLRHKKNAAPDTDNSIGKPGGLRLHFGASSIDAGGGAQFVALASLVTSQLNTLKSAISSAPVVAGDGGASFKTALVAALSAWPASVASGNLKAD